MELKEEWNEESREKEQNTFAKLGAAGAAGTWGPVRSTWAWVRRRCAELGALHPPIIAGHCFLRALGEMGQRHSTGD